MNGHHGDGTQSIFNGEKILTISFHRYGAGFYPGTRAVTDFGGEMGKGTP